MSPIRLSAILLGSACCLIATTAAAQGHSSKSAPEPVSPGGVNRLRSTTACPTFNWAPSEGAAAYELGVYALENHRTLAAAPAVRKVLPGRAAGWTPSGGDCLAPGDYVWFVREATPTGEAAGPWSEGLAISVVDGPQAPEIEATATTAGSASPAPASGQQGQPSETPPPNTHDEILAQLAVINTKLDDLLSPVSRQLCFELGAALEVGMEYGGDLDGEFEGRVGAEAYGNGVMGKVKAKPSWGFAAALKGAANPKFSICRDLGARSTATMTSAQARMAAPLTGPSSLSDDEFTTRIMALADTFQINDDRVNAALDALPTFAAGPDAWSGIRADGPVSKLADVMPLTESARQTLRDPGQIVANLRAQLSLCSQTDLPPAVVDLLQEFCGLASNERFSRLLDRVDGSVTSVKNTVTAIKTKIDDIINSLPTADDCKFFCKQP